MSTGCTPAGALRGMFSDATKNTARRKDGHRPTIRQREHRHQRVVRRCRTQRQVNAFRVQCNLCTLFGHDVPLSESTPLPPRHSQPDVVQYVTSFGATYQVIKTKASYFIRGVGVLIQDVTRRTRCLERVSYCPSAVEPSGTRYTSKAAAIAH